MTTSDEFIRDSSSITTLIMLSEAFFCAVKNVRKSYAFGSKKRSQKKWAEYSIIKLTITTASRLYIETSLNDDRFSFFILQSYIIVINFTILHINFKFLRRTNIFTSYIKYPAYQARTNNNSKPENTECKTCPCETPINDRK